MSLKKSFDKAQSWPDKVLDADKIWKQVKKALKKHNIEAPTTPRRPDVRLIVANPTGKDVTFKNPGDHSGSKPEMIPAEGKSTAAMIMLKGETLEQQNENAAILFKKYNLGQEGLSDTFVKDLSAGKLNHLIDEAYGPAPYQGQADKLVELDWKKSDGTESLITPQKSTHASYGARAATDETVFLANIHIYVKGTGTTPELVESHGMNIAIASDWQTGAESTRPIVPSVAKIYYGVHVDNIPSAIVHPNGKVKEIDLKNGSVIQLSADGKTSQLLNTQKKQATKKNPAIPK